MRPTSTPTGQASDRELIDLVDRCIRLDREHEAALKTDLTDNEDPELHALDAVICQLSREIRIKPATTLDGVLAKARLFARQTTADPCPHAGNTTYSIDPEALALSLCNDLARLQAGAGAGAALAA